MENVIAYWGKRFLLLLIVCNQSVIASAQLSAIDALKTIMIDGSDMPYLVGRPIEQFSLAAIIDGEMEPIPYQIDEYNIGGAVYLLIRIGYGQPPNVTLIL